MFCELHLFFEEKKTIIAMLDNDISIQLIYLIIPL